MIKEAPFLKTYIKSLQQFAYNTTLRVWGRDLWRHSNSRNFNFQTIRSDKRYPSMRLARSGNFGISSYILIGHQRQYPNSRLLHCQL